jgi:dTDP-4-amino-4,6-dideoxygalactose transaminase
MTQWPHFDEEQVGAVARVLRSGKVNYWTGQEGRQFEREFAEACGARFAIALANGTVALELALHVLGIGPGDEVVVTPRSFVASASTVVLRGARPVFADVDGVSQTITAETIERVISPRTRAIIAVHLAGWPCEMEPIMDLARSRGIKVIEDCAQAHGATYNVRPVGALGDLAAFSFCQDKIMTTGGEGGMLLTDDEDLRRRAWSYKDHGKGFETAHQSGPGMGFRWLHETFGTNWRMTEMQAVLGRLQLERLPGWIERRRHHAAILDSAFTTMPGLRVTRPPQHIRHAYYKYYTFLRQERLAPGWDRDRIVQAVVAGGVPCFSGSCSEIYLERAFADADLQPAAPLPMARELGETSLMFQVHPTLGEGDINRACNVLGEVLAEATMA